MIKNKRSFFNLKNIKIFINKQLKTNKMQFLINVALIMSKYIPP
jgi:hypothetical protein